jgi:hypothetical protein
MAFEATLQGGRLSRSVDRVDGLAGSLRVRGDTVPAAAAGPAPTDVLALPGAPTPLGGTIDELESYAANRVDAVAVVADLVGVSARTALFVVDSGDTIVP